MGVSGQIHAPAALPLGNTPISIEQEGWVSPRVSRRCADTVSSTCLNSYPGSSTPVAQSPKYIYHVRTNNLLSQFTRVSTLIVVPPISNRLILLLRTRVMRVFGMLHLWLLRVSAVDSVVS